MWCTEMEILQVIHKVGWGMYYETGVNEVSWCVSGVTHRLYL